MSERGVFAVDRGIWDHPSFADEPFTEREAWQWLISEAAFKARVRNVGGRKIELTRGQLAASVRFMAERWQWSKSRVDRFLKRLKTDAMIGTDSGTGLLVITLCNYDKFQRVSLPSGTHSEPHSGTAAGQQRDKREDIEDIEVGSFSNARAPALIPDDWPADYRDRFWNTYPNKVGKPKALAKLDGCRKRGIVFAEIMAGLDLYIRTKPPDRAWLNPETFINQERWTDQPASTENGNTAYASRSPGSPGAQQSGSNAILAGVAAASERRARERQQRELSENPPAARQPDFEFGGTRDR